MNFSQGQILKKVHIKSVKAYRVNCRPDIADDIAVVAVGRGERVARPREDGQLVVIIGVGLQRGWSG